MNIDLSGKIALITGGATGIGRACTQLLSQSNATVVINYEKSKEKEAQRLKEEITASGQTAAIFQADISNPDEVAALFEYISNTFGALDILVNNAGIAKETLLLLTELKEWDKIHSINLRGAFLCTRNAAELMMQNHSGTIISISSISAIRGVSKLSTYAASKGGLLSFTKSCAVELAGKGIRVNAVVPGVIETEMTRLPIKRAGNIILDRIPAARYGSAIDVANAVVFLASDNAAYITGQAISIDGGLSIS